MKQNGPKVDRMKQNRLKWTECVPKGPTWTKQTEVDQSGENGRKLTKWTKMD